MDGLTDKNRLNMSKITHPALLPAGLADILPPNAKLEAEATEELMNSFAVCGYERVKPPLIEFEDTLISGSGVATADQTFRLMDPISQRMLAIRADMTIQIARIAKTRLSDSPRPLRLSYAGQVLRIKGSILRPERQFGQVGAELIGSALPAADSEIILMAYQALRNLGIENISVDLGLPTLVSAICEHIGIESGKDLNQLRTALNQKDATAVANLASPIAQTFGPLLNSVGPATDTLKVLKEIYLPPPAEKVCQHLDSVVSLLKKKESSLTLTVDPVEIRGYEYHSGITFTFFSPAVRGELGRGGRYQITSDNSGDEATGVTLFVDTIIKSLPAPGPDPKLLALLGTSTKDIEEHRKKGYTVIEALREYGDPEYEARRLGCSHIIQNGIIEEVK